MEISTQLREAAERWLNWRDRGHPSPSEYTPGSRSGPIAMQLDSYALATYAAEQLAGDGGCEDFIALKNATETLILILGMTAIKYPGQLAVLQEAVDMVKKVLKAHSTTPTT